MREDHTKQHPISSEKTYLLLLSASGRRPTCTLRILSSLLNVPSLERTVKPLKDLPAHGLN